MPRKTTPGFKPLLPMAPGSSSARILFHFKIAVIGVAGVYVGFGTRVIRMPLNHARGAH